MPDAQWQYGNTNVLVPTDSFSGHTFNKRTNWFQEKLRVGGQKIDNLEAQRTFALGLPEAIKQVQASITTLNARANQRHVTSINGINGSSSLLHANVNVARIPDAAPLSEPMLIDPRSATVQMNQDLTALPFVLDANNVEKIARLSNLNYIFQGGNKSLLCDGRLIHMELQVWSRDNRFSFTEAPEIRNRYATRKVFAIAYELASLYILIGYAPDHWNGLNEASIYFPEDSHRAWDGANVNMNGFTANQYSRQFASFASLNNAQPDSYFLNGKIRFYQYKDHLQRHVSINKNQKILSMTFSHYLDRTVNVTEQYTDGIVELQPNVVNPDSSLRSTCFRNTPFYTWIGIFRK